MPIKNEKTAKRQTYLNQMEKPQNGQLPAAPKNELKQAVPKVEVTDTFVAQIFDKFG